MPLMPIFMSREMTNSACHSNFSIYAIESGPQGSSRNLSKSVKPLLSENVIQGTLT